LIHGEDEFAKNVVDKGTEAIEPLRNLVRTSHHTLRSYRSPDDSFDRVHVSNSVAQSIGAENDLMLGFKQIEEF
jgi:hypothetical protein